MPHTLAVPLPPQVCGFEHDPQLSVPPHPSLTEPQVAPSPEHVFAIQAGVAPHTFTLPPPPHV